MPDFFSRQVKSSSRFYRMDKRESQNHSETDQKNTADCCSRISVHAGGRETCGPGYRIDRDYFRYFGIEYVASGSGTLTIGDSDYALGPGTVFCYGPGIHHTIINTSEKDMIKYFIDIQGTAAEQLLAETQLLGAVVHTSSPQTIENSFEEMRIFGLSSSRYADELCSSLAESLIYKIAHTAFPYGEVLTASFATYIRCRNTISQLCMQLGTLQEIARVCSIDQSYLCRLFRRYDHQSPYRFLLQLQMNFAADLLLAEGLSVKETASRLNFLDQFHFSRVFKRITGHSPSSLKTSAGKPAPYTDKTDKTDKTGKTANSSMIDKADKAEKNS